MPNEYYNQLDVLNSDLHVFDEIKEKDEKGI